MAPLRRKPQGISIRKPAWFAWRVFLRLVYGVGCSIPRFCRAGDAAGSHAIFGQLGLKVSPLLL